MKNKQKVALVLALIILWGGGIWALVAQVKEGYAEKTRVDEFTDFCTLNKGVAMRDLEGKLRCVPTFSAAKGVRHD